MSGEREQYAAMRRELRTPVWREDMSKVVGVFNGKRASHRVVRSC